MSNEFNERQELGQEHAALVLETEKGLDVCGERIFQINHSKCFARQIEIENIFKAQKDYTLEQFYSSLLDSLGL